MTNNVTSTIRLSDHALRPVTELAWQDDTGPRQLAIGGTITIGSGAGVDCQLAHGTVSRLHAEIVPAPEGLWVRDLGSRNGVYIREVRIREALARAGDIMSFGAIHVATRAAASPIRIVLWPYDRFASLIGSSDGMRELFAKLAKVAGTALPVLVLGETGTGKELIAKAIHEASLRPKGPFLTVDCGALPEALMESELFGHEAGSFTGAHRTREGVFAEADGGTVFLDEVGELPLPMQTRLLRVLETGEIKRVGGTHYRKVDVRIVAATHRDLRQMVNRGTFREDLYFRLAVVALRVPPLRERRVDIPRLVEHFAEGRAGANLPELVKYAESVDWPGNVRDLRNYVERSIVLGHDPDDLAATGPTPIVDSNLTVDASEPYRTVRDRVVEYMERAYVSDLMARHGGNVSAAARAAGMNRTWLHELLKRQK